MAIHVTKNSGTSVVDLTHGVIWKQIIAFFMPVFLGSLFQEFYSVADAIIIGHFAGKRALASVEATIVLCRMFINFFVGVSSGATVIISQHFGAKRDEDLRKAIHTATAFAMSIGLGLSVICTAAAPLLLGVMHLPDEIWDMSVTYSRVYFAGSLVSLVYNMGTGILRALGDSKTPFRYLVISCFINIILDCLFVIVFKTDVLGVALATVIAQTVSAVLVIMKLARLPGSCKLQLSKMRLNKIQLGKILKVGLPVGLQGLAYSITNTIIQAKLNLFGTNVIAAWGVYARMDAFMWISLEGFGIASCTFVAQNYGAKKMDRVRSSIRSNMVISLAFSLLYSAFLLPACRHLAAIFINDKEVIRICCEMVYIITPFYATYCVTEVFSGAIRGTGESTKPMIITLIGTCVLRLIWIYGVLRGNMRMQTLIAVYPITWIITSFMFVVYYMHIRRKGRI